MVMRRHEMDGLVIPVTIMTPQRYEWIHSYMRRMDEDIMSSGSYENEVIIDYWLPLRNGKVSLTIGQPLWSRIYLLWLP